MMSSKNIPADKIRTVYIYGQPIISLYVENQERLCLAQISSTLLKDFSYNEIHNRRVALGITCIQCTPVQLEILRRAGAMPASSRRCGMITRREAERLCKSFFGECSQPALPEGFVFNVYHECAWGCTGAFAPARYNSSRAKCIKCSYCNLFFSPNKFIFHSHRLTPHDKYVQPDAANFNSWRRHLKLQSSPPEKVIYAWEDVKAMFNGGTRKRYILSTARKFSAAAAVAEKSQALLDPGKEPVTSTICDLSSTSSVITKKEAPEPMESSFNSDSCSSSTSPFAHIPHLLSQPTSTSVGNIGVPMGSTGPIGTPPTPTAVVAANSAAAAANFGFKLSCLQPFSFNGIGHFPGMVPSSSYLVPLLRPTNPKSISAAALSAFKPVVKVKKRYEKDTKDGPALRCRFPTDTNVKTLAVASAYLVLVLGLSRIIHTFTVISGLYVVV
ncbi:SKI family transcriptional corepressor 2-like isoform X1 [Wyeomyia smithii]|uniref:SKI family transcriptional corepressor 2-like isoform X1 n=1 Tax=Wyeomyia smithii TaxID=174621 RepID=UPI002467CB0B|nr:SKI family transcriptional corepressor 2-like isoform X1 [Wyeomyia smithii]XP_055525885.1 SKI family transcriptional corepressor 2-like isoform X1 [Wyeomyia smithii]XP_055525886.1 SKI family transcriptional corepressor 2-like isoform X1 [Wyeomyia smithii]